MVAALLPFVTFECNSVSRFVEELFDVLAQLYATSQLQVRDLERVVQVMVKMTLRIVEKPALLSSAQVTELLGELLELSSEQPAEISKAVFVGSWVIQAEAPVSLNMQRLVAIVLRSCSQGLKRLWNGEMPYLYVC